MKRTTVIFPFGKIGLLFLIVVATYLNSRADASSPVDTELASQSGPTLDVHISSMTFVP